MKYPLDYSNLFNELNEVLKPYGFIQINKKEIQKKYLILMKELLKKDSVLAIEIISEELNELGFINKDDVKRLIIKK